MMRYTAGASGEAFELGGAEAYLAFQGGIDGHSYSYTLGSNDMKEARLNPQSVNVPMVGTWAAFDRLLRQAEADIAAGKPGTISKDGWSKRAYIVGASHKRSTRGLIRTDLKIALLDGAWWKLGKVSLVPGQDSSSGGGLDYAYDYGHDYNPPSTGGTLDTESLVPCKPRLVFYGPVTDPYIIVAGNKYQVSGTIASGARVEVDGKDKTVRLIGQDGSVTDKFSDALRGSGEGGGEYIFQPFPPGSDAVTWDDSFGVDIMWYREAGEPPWSQS